MKKFILSLCLLLISATLIHAQSASNTTSEPKTDKVQKPSVTPPAELRVLDISERTYQGGPAVAVLFSEALDPIRRYDDFMRIRDKEQTLKSAWVLSEDHRILYFPNVEPETEYAVSVLQTFCNANGNCLKKQVDQTVVTREVSPVVSFAGEGLLLPAKMTQGLPVVTVNVPAVDLEFFRLNDEQKALFEFVDWQDSTGRKDYDVLENARHYGELVFSGRFDLDAPPNRRTVCHIPVEGIPALQAPGVYLAVMREPGEYDYSYQSTYFMVTDIGLHARIYENESFIVAASLKTGDPLFDVNLTLYDEKGNIIKEGFTDSEGCFRYDKTMKDVYLIKAAAGDHVTVLSFDMPALDLSEFDFSDRPYTPTEVFVYSPRDLYRPGEKMIVSALLRDDDGKTTSPMPLNAKLFRPDGKEVRSFVWHQFSGEAAGQRHGVSGQGSAPPHPSPLTSHLYYQTELQISGDAQTGLWHLEVRDNPASEIPAGYYEFHVEDFLPERMKLDLSALSQEAAGPEADVQIAVSGEYLYGAPADGNAIDGRVIVKAKREVFGNLKGFEFGDIKDKDYKDFWDLEEQVLDKQGKTTLTVESRWKEIRSPLSLRAIVNLYESGGRPVTRRIEQTVFPAKTLIGIRPLFKDGSADEGPVNFEIVNCSYKKGGTDGLLLSARNLMVDVTKEDRDYFWEYSSDEDVWHHRYAEKNYQVLTETLNLEPGKPKPYTLHLENGQYVFAVKDPETGLSTSIRFYVGHRWRYDGESEGAAARPDKVLLSTDKPAYRSGDTIQLTVTPPHDGDAAVLVESKELLWSKRLKVSAKGTVVSIPVSERWNTHNIYISATVFRPADAAEKITPNRALGIIHLPLDRSDRKLDIRIDAPKKAASQGPLTVKLKIGSEVRGQRSEVGEQPPHPSPLTPHPTVFFTLAAVDVGILNITEFKTPDPFGWFFEPRSYHVSLYDIYGKVIETMDGKAATIRWGGDEDSGGKKPDSEVKLLSLFQAPVAFDEAGEALITFDMPDFNGKVRLMAVAFGTDSFGSAESEVIVAAPTVTQLAMPRFLSPGDQSELTLDVHNLSGKDQQLSLAMTAENPLALEKGNQTLQLADQEKTTLRFPVKASADCGFASAVIRLFLKGEGIALERDWKLGIRPAYPAIARKVRKILRPPAEGGSDEVRGAGSEVRGETASPASSERKLAFVPEPKPATTEKSGAAVPTQSAGASDEVRGETPNPEPRTFNLDNSLVEDLIPNTVEADVKISTVIPLDIRSAMRGLISYPYGCLEQTTSRAFPLLSATPENIQKYRLPPVSLEDRMNWLDKAVERISAMQLASGGFGLWSKSSPEVPWLTAYVTEFLINAQKAGVSISDEMTENALKRLRQYLNSSEDEPLYAYSSQSEKAHLDFAVKSYAAYLLTQAERWVDLGTLRTLYDNHREEAGSGLPLAHLAFALEKQGDEKRSAEAFKSAAQKRCARYGYWGDYGSLMRDLALTLAFFIENKKDGVEGFELMMLDLEEELHHREWLSTQEQFAVFKAGLTLEGRAGQKWKGRLTVGGKESVLEKKGTYVFSPKVRDIADGITFVSETPGFLYTSAIINGYTKTPPPKDDSKISVLRELYDTKGNFIKKTEFNVGDLLLVHLRINASEWLPDALIVDLVPAGFEIENQNLMHSVKLDDIKMEGNPIWRLREQANVIHEEYRDDRYVAVTELEKDYPIHLFYLVRAVSPGKFSAPPPFAESMYRPEIRGIGETPAPITVVNKKHESVK